MIAPKLPAGTPWPRPARPAGTSSAPVSAEGQSMVTEADLQFYQNNGYVVIRGLFSPEEVARYRDYFMAMRSTGPLPLDDTSWYLNSGDDDPLKKYPRIIQSHRWDDVSKQWLLDPRLKAV